jgi:hypothetical protein
MPFRTLSHVRLPILAAALALAACGDITPPITADNPSPDLQLLAKGPARPTGTGIGLVGSKAQRTAQPAEYHGGRLIATTSHAYLIWYGSWAGSTAPQILTDLASSLGGSSYFDAITRYRNPAGAPMPNAVQYGGSINDSYSQGTSLSNYHIAMIVGDAIINGSLPPDPEGIYVVLTSADVDETSGFGTQYCGFRSTTSVNGMAIKTVFIGHPDRVPTKCKPQAVGPNGNAAADAMATVLVNEIFNTMLDPEFTGWYDKFEFEPADKCAWSFGKTYKTANGARANMALGGRNYLLQELWVPSAGGFCTLDVNTAL